MAATMHKKKKLDYSEEAQILAAQRMIAIKKSKTSLLDFIQFTMPDPEHPGDVTKSKFQICPHHRLLAEALEKVATGECLRLAISMPPQHGKSETASRRFPAWLMGKFPWKKLMFGTYNQDFAESFGGEVREILQSSEFKLIFPSFALRADSKAKGEMRTTDGGQLFFIGRGGGGSGKPADIFIIDDPLKNDEEAQSQTTRKALWEWYTKVVYARCHVKTAIVIIHTRWHEDDLIGRICDPDHPDHDPKIAKEWLYINIPAIQDDPEIAGALGKKIGDALWPERFPVSHLNMAKRLNPRGFSALYQGKPAPDDGDFFKADWLVEYDRDEMPEFGSLTYYAASDHAVTTNKKNDPSCMGAIGIDSKNIIWVMPDLIWEHMETDRVVEEMIRLMKHYKPHYWWAENDVIKKAIGPFLRRRMREENCYVTIDPQTPSQDKRTRARSIQGLLAMQQVRFPRFAPWWMKAKHEMLKFDNGKNDDFVDWIAWIGRGLDSEFGKLATPDSKKESLVTGTIAWIKAQTRRQERQHSQQDASGF